MDGRDGRLEGDGPEEGMGGGGRGGGSQKGAGTGKGGMESQARVTYGHHKLIFHQKLPSTQPEQHYHPTRMP